MAKWLDHQAGKVAAALDTLEAAPPPADRNPTVGDIALACALGYLDFRLEGRWRADHPRLVAWYDSFVKRAPLFLDSAPS